MNERRRKARARHPSTGGRELSFDLDGRLLEYHSAAACRCACPFHRPSDHRMATWKIRKAANVPYVQRVCAHGFGHPDPDSLRYLELFEGFDPLVGSHQCDGCCSARPNCLPE